MQPSADHDSSFLERERPSPGTTYVPIGTRRRPPTGVPRRGSGGDRLVRTVAEAAEMLGISRALAYRLVKTGKLRHIRLGRRVLVPFKAIQELVDES